MSQKPSKTARTLKRVLRAVGLSTAVAFVGLSAAASPAWANASLQAGQIWSGSYRCAAISGRASLEVTRFEPIADRPGWQRIEATLTIEESGRRGVARFAGNNPTHSERFLIGLAEWVEKPAGVEFQRLRLQPMRDSLMRPIIGVNVHGRPECVINGVDTFAFTVSPNKQSTRTPQRQVSPAEIDERLRMRQDALDEMHQRDEENRRRAAEDRRRLDEQERAQREALEQANEIRRRQLEQWEAEERRRRGF